MALGLVGVGLPGDELAGDELAGADELLPPLRYAGGGTADDGSLRLPVPQGIA